MAVAWGTIGLSYSGMTSLTDTLASRLWNSIHFPIKKLIRTHVLPWFWVRNSCFFNIDPFSMSPNDQDEWVRNLHRDRCIASIPNITEWNWEESLYWRLRISPIKKQTDDQLSPLRVKKEPKYLSTNWKTHISQLADLFSFPIDDLEERGYGLNKKTFEI